ncbi:MAG: GTPase domain-containing protein [Ferroplasma sp.]
MVQKLTWKVTVTGKKNSGKSSLISQIVYNSPSTGNIRGFIRKKVNFDFMSENYDIDLLFLEMPFEILNEKFLSKSTFVLLVVDITDMDSLYAAQKFLKTYNDGMDIFLIATKSDLRYTSQFWEPEIAKIASTYNIIYFISNNTMDFSGTLNEILGYVLTKIYNHSK